VQSHHVRMHSAVFHGKPTAAVLQPLVFLGTPVSAISADSSALYIAQLCATDTVESFAVHRYSTEDELQTRMLSHWQATQRILYQRLGFDGTAP
jgi:hypothetical protein